jgi:hypothetical protein
MKKSKLERMASDAWLESHNWEDPACYQWAYKQGFEAALEYVKNRCEQIGFSMTDICIIEDDDEKAR